MQFLLDDAVRKIKKGVTTVEEVLRVIHLREEATSSCPKCNALIRARVSACPSCLAQLRNLCQSCGQELKSDWRTCPYCNRLVDSNPQSDSKSRTEHWTQ
jgi:predicted nucleic acid-binding Zn ribbon protein